ncbi:MAG: hypothetical protein AMJ78_05550 [Omnitrophica WOR_2 bacterium SM23_29]|nr:MAG: hypothetical protein AMJ78_05550 [Omnitrophica WOR_2 bacterium SM23_29]
MRGNLVKSFVVGLMFLSMIVLNAEAEQSEQISLSSAVSLQNFEPENGTEDEYFLNIWETEPDFATDIVHSGSRSLEIEAINEAGGTVGIKVASEDGYVDLSNGKKISIWVYDAAEGNNTIQIRLKDTEGNGGSGEDGNFLWSSKKTKKDAWTQIKWDLKKYPKVEDLDLTQISSIEIYVPVEGTYYLDDVELME